MLIYVNKLINVFFSRIELYELHIVPENITVGTPTIRGLQLKSTNIVIGLEETYQLKQLYYQLV